MIITVRNANNTYRATAKGSKLAATNTAGPHPAAEALARKMGIDPSLLSEESHEQFITTFSHPSPAGNGAPMSSAEMADILQRYETTAKNKTILKARVEELEAVLRELRFYISKAKQIDAKAALIFSIDTALAKKELSE